MGSRVRQPRSCLPARWTTTGVRASAGEQAIPIHIAYPHLGTGAPLTSSCTHHAWTHHRRFAHRPYLVFAHLTLWQHTARRSSLTSLSLGGTCVSSPALPLLAACCPGLARLSITGGGSGGARDGGRKVAGWAVLLAARVRAEQLRSQKATDALGAQARGATGAKVPREGELMEAVESAGTAEGSQRVQGRPAERPLEAVPWVSLSVAGLGEWEEELEEGLEAAGWRTGWAAGIEDGDGGREAAGGRGGVGGDGYLERLARLLASGLGRQRTGQCGVLGTAGVEKGVSGERLQGGPTAGGRLQGNMAGRVRAQQERDGEWEQDFGEWEEMYEVARGRERYRDWSHELTREAAAVAERLRGGGGGMLEDLFGGPCAEVVGGLTSLDMAGVEQVGWPRDGTHTFVEPGMGPNTLKAVCGRR